MERNKFDDLMEKVMHYEAKTGNKAKVVVKTSYLEVLKEHAKEFFEHLENKEHAIFYGHHFYINNEQEEDYTISRDWTER